MGSCTSVPSQVHPASNCHSNSTAPARSQSKRRGRPERGSVDLGGFFANDKRKDPPANAGEKKPSVGLAHSYGNEEPQCVPPSTPNRDVDAEPHEPQELVAVWEWEPTLVKQNTDELKLDDSTAIDGISAYQQAVLVCMSPTQQLKSVPRRRSRQSKTSTRARTGTE